MSTVNRTRLVRTATAGVFLGVLVFGALVAATPMPRSVAAATGKQVSPLPKPQYSDDGQMLRPDKSYRRWIQVGTPLTPNELNLPAAPFPEFHSVYVHPDDFDHYAETGEWRDGTYIVKELITIGAKSASSGNGYFMGDFTGLEVAVKDSRRFPDEPGYWAYFSFGHEYPLADAASIQPSTQCNVCHASNAKDDWVFTQYYPVARDAAPGGGR